MTLPTDAAARKAVPITTGFIDYFPDAMVEVAILSRIGNDQHNPGQPLHWAKDKSTDHANCIVRHLLERGTIDTDGVRHSAKVAWRAMALLQIEIEKARKPIDPHALVTATEARLAHNADPTTRHGGLPVMQEQSSTKPTAHPLPKFERVSKHGFTVGETVNLHSAVCHPGKVVGFTNGGILVLWESKNSGSPSAWAPNELRHGE